MGPTIDAVFKALADETRRRMLGRIRASPGVTVSALCEPFSMSRVGAAKHLQVLVDAGLVRSQKKGRRRLLSANPVGLAAAIRFLAAAQPSRRAS